MEGGGQSISGGCILQQRKWQGALHASDRGARHGPVDLIRELAVTF